VGVYRAWQFVITVLTPVTTMVALRAATTFIVTPAPVIRKIEIAFS